MSVPVRNSTAQAPHAKQALGLRASRAIRLRSGELQRWRKQEHRQSRNHRGQLHNNSNGNLGINHTNHSRQSFGELSVLRQNRRNSLFRIRRLLRGSPATFFRILDRSFKRNLRCRSGSLNVHKSAIYGKETRSEEN